MQATLRNLQTAYSDAATSFRNCFTFRDGQLTLAKQDAPLRVVWSRPLPEGALPSQVTVSRDSRGVLHKLTTRLVRNMVRNRSSARAIHDASWSELRRRLEYKADWYRRQVIAIDRWYPSSKTCSVCGAIVEKLPLNVREWTCPCGARHDRDVNAARNIHAAGLAVSASGG